MGLFNFNINMIQINQVEILKLKLMKLGLANILEIMNCNTTNLANTLQSQECKQHALLFLLLILI